MRHFLLDYRLVHSKFCHAWLIMTGFLVDASCVAMNSVSVAVFQLHLVKRYVRLLHSSVKL